MKPYRQYILDSCGIKVSSGRRGTMELGRKQPSSKALPAIPFSSANVFNTVFLSLHLQTRIFSIINLMVYSVLA
jgi:hypothetical protein